jgi:iron complex transport system substrate-binding protein
MRLIALMLAALPLTSFAAAQPTRIVSLNPCIDGLLVELAPREHIAAISHYSRDPWRSTIADIARTLPITYETAEEVVSIKPDLVLAGRHSALATRNALSRVGIRFELFDVPMSIAESHEQVRRLAALLHETDRGEALIARIDAAMEHARPAADTPRLTAAVYQPGGLTAGKDTITDELMGIVGLENAPARYDVRQHRPIGLEQLLQMPPDILLVGDTTEAAPTHAERIVNHRALRALGKRTIRMEYSARLLYCAGPTMIHAVAALAHARDEALRIRNLQPAQPVQRVSAASERPHGEAR